ncbi:hypothetical protein E1B28_011589 [Marasmius oreades]|uniref:Prokaryotic-type class I peptide chain release factors domain-containing protein n=1 Tax=Marasmius oreades TaxID=181124 RepID=A0A9P7RUE1_9AGAR|nr:uncharacterized protein E1B28_011589 [Marasmius oreades]KAG7089964.1 hypothetical protein E1B28_011589 [Marasmius oreades]
MLRTRLRLPRPPPSSIQRYSHYKPLPTPPNLSIIETPEDSQKARSWISQFKQSPIPRKSVELSFSASSGPGGQHVNRTNSKATLRCSLDSGWIPPWAKQTLSKSPQYVASTASLLITSSFSRSQLQNVNDCLSKLHDLILSAASSTLKNETPVEQKKHVAKLEDIAKQRRRKEKSHRSDLKRSRGKASGGAWD